MRNGEAKILALGDICGKCGTEAVAKKLWDIRKECDADMVIANGENAAVGNGLDRESAEILLQSGVDVITGGNHIFRKSSVYSLLDDSESIIRPANYPAECPGSGYCIFDMCSYRVLVMNLLGTVYMESLESPFAAADRILRREEGNFDLAITDIHAEATSEKIALAKYLDGRVAAVFGTHTHVQTADEKILPGGTGFICDLGMCGAADSVLGIKNEIILRKFLTKMPVRHEEAEGEAEICGCVFTVAVKDGKCTGVQRVRYTL